MMLKNIMREILLPYGKYFLKPKRKPQLLENIPDIFEQETVLYVGARTTRIDFGPELRDQGCQIDVLEIFPENVEYLERVNWINKVIEGDVRNAPELVDQQYDLVFWWHGPEHIRDTELKKTLDGLVSISSKLVVCGCPWGDVPQRKVYGNPHEAHINAVQPEHFTENGFNTLTLGRPNMYLSNILAWHRK